MHAQYGHFVGFAILHRVIASAALHDAAESYPQPRCHPETRQELLDTLWAWCTDHNTEQRILWLHGVAGAGKSAVMKTLSERLQDAQRLGATFFFKHSHPTRGKGDALFATIAFQLAINIPELKQPLSRIVEDNPMIVSRAIGVQLQELIIGPCRAIEFSPDRTIIIDGLDECEGRHIQQDILRFLAESIAQRRIPLRFIIASRPEPHIREVFQGSCLSGLHRPFNVEQSFEDVRAYLESEFARIHGEHSTMAAVQKPWPALEVIDRLVDKSSGFFIYASTVIKFIDDPDYRPTRRLAAIEDLPGNHSKSPVAALDALYGQILSANSENRDLVRILRVVCHFNLKYSHIDELLGLESGDVELSLRGLHSVIHPDEETSVLAFVHASFRDFLNDASRAGDFYIGEAGGLENLMQLVLSELGYMYEDPKKNRTVLLAE
jgi:hypothetical protein